MPALARARIGDMTMFLPNEIAPRQLVLVSRPHREIFGVSRENDSCVIVVSLKTCCWVEHGPGCKYGYWQGWVSIRRLVVLSFLAGLYSEPSYPLHSLLNLHTSTFHFLILKKITR